MNSIKTAMLLGLMTGLLMFVGKIFGGNNGMMIMLVISLGINFYSYWYSDKIVLKAYGGREVTMSDEPDFVGMIARLARKNNMPMPKVYILDMDAPNAFATGRDPEHAAVAATRSIMRILTTEELEGVMAHELSHVKHRDTLVSTIAASIAGVITYIAQIAQYAMIFGGRSNDDDNGGAMGSIFMIILAPIAAMLIQMGISRSREYMADQAGGELSGNPLALASALKKLENYALTMNSRRGTSEATPATSHLFIINPFSGLGGISNLFSTHPKTADRVAKLQEQADMMRYRK